MEPAEAKKKNLKIWGRKTYSCTYQDETSPANGQCTSCVHRGYFLFFFFYGVLKSPHNNHVFWACFGAILAADVKSGRGLLH